MDERPQQTGPGEPFQVSARLAEPSSDALGGADLEPPADEPVEADAARDDIASRLCPVEVDLVEDLGLDQRQLVPAAGLAERPTPGRVAVTFEPPSRDGGHVV